VLPHPLLQINFKKNELAQNLPVSINIKKSETRPEKCKKNRFNNNNKKNRSIDSNPFTDNNG
jgi:hypothetical protein